MTTGRLKRIAVVRLLQKLQHAAPVPVLFREGLPGLSGPRDWHMALSVAELATSAAVVVSLVIAIRALIKTLRAGETPHLHVGIDWIDIFLGLMLFTEVAAKYPESHKWWRPATLLGIVMIVLGIYGGKIAKWKAEKRERGAAG